MDLSPWLSFWIEQTKQPSCNKRWMRFFLLSPTISYYHLFIFIVYWFFGFCFFYSSAWERSFSQKKIEMEEVGCNTVLYFLLHITFPGKLSLVEMDQWHPILAVAKNSGLFSSIYRSSCWETPHIPKNKDREDKHLHICTESIAFSYKLKLFFD